MPTVLRARSAACSGTHVQRAWFLRRLESSGGAEGQPGNGKALGEVITLPGHAGRTRGPSQALVVLLGSTVLPAGAPGYHSEIKEHMNYSRQLEETEWSGSLSCAKAGIIPALHSSHREPHSRSSDPTGASHTPSRLLLWIYRLHLLKNIKVLFSELIYNL